MNQPPFFWLVKRQTLCYTEIYQYQPATRILHYSGAFLKEE